MKAEELKVINNLVVLRVPKQRAGLAVVPDKYGNTVQYWDNEWHIANKLPEGEFEIIGTLDELCNGSPKKDEVINAAKHSNGILTSLLLTHGIISMTPDINQPETDLLFLKRI